MKSLKITAIRLQLISVELFDWKYFVDSSIDADITAVATVFHRVGATSMAEYSATVRLSVYANFRILFYSLSNQSVISVCAVGVFIKLPKNQKVKSEGQKMGRQGYCLKLTWLGEQYLLNTLYSNWNTLSFQSLMIQSITYHCDGSIWYNFQIPVIHILMLDSYRHSIRYISTGNGNDDIELSLARSNCRFLRMHSKTRTILT